MGSLSTCYIFQVSNQFERIIYACLALVFFRVFDILKPFPISYFDKKYKNGFGIVLDDIIAGIFSGIPKCAYSSFFNLDFIYLH